MLLLVALDLLTALYLSFLFVMFAYFYRRWWRLYPLDREDAPPPWVVNVVTLWAVKVIGQPAVTTLVEMEHREWRVPLNIAFNLLGSLGMLTLLQNTAKRKTRQQCDAP